MKSRSGSVQSGLPISRGEALSASKQWMVSKSESEDSGVEMASCPLNPGSEPGLPGYPCTANLWQIPQVSVATPLSRHRSEQQVGQGPELGVAEGPFPLLEPVHQKLEQALQRTLSRKPGGAMCAWESGPQSADGLHLQRSLVSLKPLARSQPVLGSCGEGAWRGSQCPLRRVPIPNSTNQHPEERWADSRSGAPGLRYLQQVCRLLDRIANLQECNVLLKQDKMEMEERLRQKERQQEAHHRACSCGSAARLLESGQPHEHGHKDSLHNPTTPAQQQPCHPPQPSLPRAHYSFQKRWASDSSIFGEATMEWSEAEEVKGDTVLHSGESDSSLSRNEGRLAARIHRQTGQPDTATMTKDHRPHWDRVKQLVTRLRVKSGRGQSFVDKLKVSIHQNHS
uniref:uncharacterized protein n=1 Tax=Pristiophorus japonicus TaxID=55135 RepID=UPI00398ECBC3